MSDKQESQELKSRRDRSRFLNEYLFYQAMRTANVRHVDQGNKAMTCSQARGFHDAFEKSIEDSGQPIRGSGKIRVLFGLKDALGDFLPEEVLAYERVIQDGKAVYNWPWYDEQLEKFREITGFVAEPEAGVYYLPISPYDSEFALNSVFLDNGDSLLYHPLQTTYHDGANFLSLFDESGDYDASRASDALLYKLDDDGNYRYRGRLQTYDDLSGISAFRPYMSADDYESVRSWINDVGKKDKSRFMSPEAIRRGSDILRMMQNEGLSYTIHKDPEHEGQINAHIDNTKIRVRLTDLRQYEHYIGSVYDDGYRYRFSTTKLDENRYRVPYDKPTSEDTLLLLRYAMGERLPRKDSQQLIGELNTRRRGRYVVRDVYYSDEARRPFTATVGPYPGDSWAQIRLRVENNRNRGSYFASDEQAEAYLKEAVRSARANFMESVALEDLIKQAEEHASDEDYVPEYSGDADIAAIQESYWQVLSGQEVDLLRVGKTREDYEADLSLLNLKADPELDNMLDAIFANEEGAFEPNLLKQDLEKQYFYEGSSIDKVRLHLVENLDALIGQYEEDEHGKTFDPVLVSKFMDSNYREFRNNDDIVAALVKLEKDADTLRGDDFYNQTFKDRLIRFDEKSARVMSTHENTFIRSMGEEIEAGLLSTGCSVEKRDIRIDENGVVKYEAKREFGERVNSQKKQEQTFTGLIGQIFAPNDDKTVYTAYAGSENYMFVPGYEAYVVPQKPGENLNMVERTRLRGYEQMMRQQIRYQLRSDILASYNEVGTSTSVNGVYRRLYDNRHSYDFMERSLAQGMSVELRDAIIETEARRVRYLTPYRDESTINADYRARLMQSMGEDPYALINDNDDNMYARTGQTNMSIMDEQGDGYFDIVATGTGINQGVTRFLLEGASVDGEGRILKSEIENDRTPLMKHEVCQFMAYTPFDRQQMTFSNLMNAAAIAPKIKTVHMTFGGWTFDDGFVVSKRFAETYRVMGKDGEMRDLMVGDKLSDMNGNKGVISLIVDPQMPLAEAQARELEQAVAWFKANPELDVVGAPYTAPSRYNGGTALEMMQNTSDLKSPRGKVFEGAIGEANFIITDMIVDEKTHIYGIEELAQGKGRKMSGQLAWALNSHDADEVLREAYRTNSKALINLREYLITCGMDISETGQLRNQYMPHEGEERAIWTLPELEYRENNGKQVLDVRSMLSKFSHVVSQKGGFLELPFALEYPNGSPLRQLNAEKTALTNADDFDPNLSFALPVMSSYLRSGQILDDGTSHVHDYTNHYLKIYESALRYKDAALREDQAEMAKQKAKAQSEFNVLSSDVISRRFEGKYNIFKSEIMANRMPNSVTAVWTADPRLDIDEIGMSSRMANAMSVEDGDYILMWRDPILRDAGVRYNKVKIQEGLTGITINPAMDKSFDGDFDGDAVGAINLRSKAARECAREKLSVSANLLDYGSVNEDGTHPLFIQNGMDLKSVAAKSKKFRDKLDLLEKQANSMHLIKPEARASAERRLTKELSEVIRQGFSKAYGLSVISYKDIESHLRSVEPMVQTGAKGSYSKLQAYGAYLGAKFELKEDAKGNQSIDYDTLEIQDKPFAGREELKGVQYATAIKSFGTGVAGKFSQRGVSALRNYAVKGVLELTYPVTQAILQSKHDPVEARHKYENLMGPARRLWRGLGIEEVYDEASGQNLWRQTESNDALSKDEWVKTFTEFYASKSGLNVGINPDYVTEIAEVLADENGFIRNIEEDKDLHSPMDRLAYDGNWDDLKVLTAREVSLFDGRYNQYFAPQSVISNQEIKVLKELDLDPDFEVNTSYEVLSKKDTGLDYEPKRGVSQVATVVKKPQVYYDNDNDSVLDSEYE